MASCRIAETFHFQESNLVETSRKNVDHMAIVRYSFCEIVVELLWVSCRLRITSVYTMAYLQGLFVVFDIVFVNVVV